MPFNPKALWKKLGGTLRPGDARAHDKERGTVWMADNDALGITDKRTKRHPVVVITRTSSAEVMVTIGSDSHSYDLDSVTATFDSGDLVPDDVGIGFKGRTTFDFCLELPVPESALLSYMGRLNSVAWARVLAARGKCI